MVKTNVRFLALSLLMPAMALAGWMPTKRDATQAFVGGTLAFVQNKVGYQGAGLVLAPGNNAKLQDHAATALTAWTFKDGAVAAFFGKFHTDYIGQWANNAVNPAGADTTVTLRDQTAATVGKIVVNAFNSNWKVNSATFTTAIDPFYAVATAQYLYANKASLWSSAQAAEQATLAGYNAAATSSTDAAKKAK